MYKIQPFNFSIEQTDDNSFHMSDSIKTTSDGSQNIATGFQFPKANTGCTLATNASKIEERKGNAIVFKEINLFTVTFTDFRPYAMGRFKEERLFSGKTDFTEINFHSNTFGYPGEINNLPGVTVHQYNLSFDVTRIRSMKVQIIWFTNMIANGNAVFVMNLTNSTSGSNVKTFEYTYTGADEAYSDQVIDFGTINLQASNSYTFKVKPKTTLTYLSSSTYAYHHCRFGNTDIFIEETP
eukprot:Pgem_evm1s20157